MPTTPPDIFVIAIQSIRNDLYALTMPNVSIRIIDELNPDILRDIIRDSKMKHAVIILEKEAFEGYESPMRAFIRKIRGSHGENPRILVLRRKSMGKDNPTLTDGDRTAGADAVLWYQLSSSAKELTREIYRFIHDPSTNFSQHEAPQTRRPPSKFGMKETPHPQTKAMPKKRELSEKIAPKSTRVAQPTPSSPTRAREMAIFREIPEKRRATVTLSGTTIELRKSIAITLLALVNEPAEISQRDLMKKIGITTRQPVYERIKRLKDDLDTHSPGLGTCIIRTEKEGERHLPLPWYRFDHDIWCSVLGIK